MAWPFEPEHLHRKFLTGSGVAETNWVFNSTLTFYDFNGASHPLIALEIPTQENGDWEVNPDGTMVTTYRLRENGRWHDGAPLTAHDFVFAYGVYVDPEIPVLERMPEALMSAVEASDDYTLVITWSQTYTRANLLGDRELNPLPRHLLEEKYRTNKPNFAAGEEWSRSYVGTGPFRVEQWTPGAGLIARAHPDWLLGPPKLDTLDIRFISDSNLMLTNLLSGEVDIITTPGIRAPEAAIARDQWVASGEGYLKTWETRLSFVEFQYRDVQGWQQAVSDVRVRQALLHAIDRQGIVDVVNYGLGSVADTFVLRTDPVFPDIDRTLTKYPPDPARAAVLLAQAGWQQARDGGSIANSAGQTLDLEVRSSAGQEREATIVADNIKAIGVNSSLFIVPAARARDAEMRTGYPGMALNGRSIAPEHFPFTSADLPTPENQFAGLNRGSFQDREVDRLHGIIMTDLQPEARRGATIALHRRMSELAAYGPLLYRPEIILAKNKVQGPTGNFGPQQGITWNIFEWEVTE